MGGMEGIEGMRGIGGMGGIGGMEFDFFYTAGTKTQVSQVTQIRLNQRVVWLKMGVLGENGPGKGLFG